MPENRIVSVDDLLVDAVLDGLSRVTATQFFFFFFVFLFFVFFWWICRMLFFLVDL